MGKQRQAKKHRRELMAEPAPKQMLRQMEAVPDIKVLMKKLDEIHAERASFMAYQMTKGDSDNSWPASVYFPSTFVAAMINPDLRVLALQADNGNPLDIQKTTEVFHQSDRVAQDITTLLAWRVGQGIYQFDQAMMEELMKTEISDEIPVDVFTRLPEWCLYVEFPLHTGSRVDGGDAIQLMDGFFVYCDQQPIPDNKKFAGMFESMMIVPLMKRQPTEEESGDYLFPIMIPLIEGMGAVKCVELGLMKYTNSGNHEHIVKFTELLKSIVHVLLPMVLYLCSDEPDITGKFGQPKRGKPRLTPAERLGPLGEVKKWTVGSRLGAALRKFKDHDEKEEDDMSASTGQRKRPHLRKAHYHGYWYGPRSAEKRDYRYRWVAPTLINVGDSDDVVPTIHPVG